MFPNYKKKLWWKVPDGWEDLGVINGLKSLGKNGATITSTEAHAVCNDFVNIGREDGKAFRFCKRCLVKL